MERDFRLKSIIFDFQACSAHTALFAFYKTMAIDSFPARNEPIYTLGNSCATQGGICGRSGVSGAQIRYLDELVQQEHEVLDDVRDEGGRFLLLLVHFHHFHSDFDTEINNAPITDYYSLGTDSSIRYSNGIRARRTTKLRGPDRAETERIE